MFYANGVKRIPSNIHTLLKNDLVLSVWFMDDGNIRKIKDKEFREKINKYIIPSLRYKLWPRRD
jgi:hypothetical protein